MLKKYLVIVLCVVATVRCLGQITVTAERLTGNPIITPEMIPGPEGGNINGPSLVKVPAWVKKPLGKYYLYFAHHEGKYIRMAYADDLNGPWKIYEPGVMQNTETIFGNGPDKEMDLLGMKEIWVAHIASPDVVLDFNRRVFRMYFHGLGPKTGDCHCTSVAESKDGLHFTTVLGSDTIKDAYLRQFDWKGYDYFVGRLGKLWRSSSGVDKFEEGPNPFLQINKQAALRHSAILLRYGSLLVFYSRMGDKPERIVVSEIKLNGDWKTWKASEPIVVLEPEKAYEGANLELKASEPGNAKTRLRELRDPAIFTDDGKTYLLYSIQGESGIAIAELKIN